MSDADVQIAQATAGDSIGTVANVAGAVSIARADGARVDAAVGTPLFQGDAVETQANGRIGILFADDSTFALGESGRMVLDEMVYDPAAQSGKSAISVATGLFSFISGQIAKTGVDAMVISTPVAQIGIRGTSGAGKAAAEGQTNTFSLLPDADGSVGQAVVKTQTGVQTLSTAYHTTQFSSRFMPPAAPVVLPAAVASRAYGAVTQSLPPSPAAASPTGQPAGPTGPAEAGAATQAAGAVFEQALARGVTLDAAFAAAVQTGVNVGLVAPGAVAGGPAGADAEAMARAIGLALTETLGPVFAAEIGGAAALQAFTAMGGPGGPGAFGPAPLNPSLFLDPGAGQFGSGGRGDPFGFGGPEGPFGSTPFGREAFDRFGPNLEFIFERPEFDPFGFEGNFGPPREPRDNDPSGGTINQFDQTISNFTTDGETRVGGGLNDQFIMVQGSTLGGIDIVDGGSGTDELSFKNLSNIQVILDLSTLTVKYANSDNSVNGQITLRGIEQFHANDAAGSAADASGASGVSFNRASDGVRVGFDATDTLGFGYLLAGTTGNDTLSLATGQSLNFLSGTGSTVADASGGSFLGSIIFGGGGNDTITGSSGKDIVFGGVGDDVIRGGNGNDAEFGGAGNDTFIVGESAEIVVSGSATGGAFQGGDGTDTVQVGVSGASTTSYNFLSASPTGMAGIEKFSVFNSNVTITGSNAVLGALTNIEAVSGQTPTGVAILGGSDTVLNMQNVTMGSVVSTLSIASGLLNSGVQITDNLSDAVGRTLTGGSGADKFHGSGGADAFNLGSGDTAQDKVYYSNTTEGAAAGAVTGMDAINNFNSSHDRVVFATGSVGPISGFDDVTVNNVAQVQTSTATNNANLSLSEVIHFATAVTNAQLTTAGFAAVIAAVGTVTAGTATAADAQNDAIFIVNGATQAGVYLYTNSNGAGANNNTVESGELTLLAVVDSTLGPSNVEFATGVHM